MKKIIFLAFVFSNIFCNIFAFELQNIISINIPKQDDSNSIKIPSMDLKVGESGIVSRNVNDNEFIIANALVADISDGVATLEISDFNQMNEKYMPKPLGKVSEGDKVIFRMLYDKAILIAPNQNAYQEITAQFGNIDFLHSDVFAVFLAKDSEDLPKAEDFSRFCDEFDLGLVFIALENRIDILNCKSFKRLDSASFSLKDSAISKPFFTRLSDGAIEELFNVEKIDDYFVYFHNLIESHNGDSANKAQ